MTTILSQKQIKEFQNKILEWYRKNQRDLPWRKSRDPYYILVSEVMSQQTQIARVVVKYEAWMKRFPTLHSLAVASTRDVLQYWSGLGYNRRALFLKKCAEEIVKNYEGLMPQTEEALKKFPGIGEYTARALLCFAFDQQIAVVDTNVRKVILVHFFPERAQEPSTPQEYLLQGSSGASSGKKVVSDKEIKEIAEQLLPADKAYIWNQALMDYASEVLKEHKIPLPKQSKFEDSDRYYRGQILKVLLEKQSIHQKELEKFFMQKISAERLGKIVQSLQNDSFIAVADEEIQLR